MRQEFEKFNKIYPKCCSAFNASALNVMKERLTLNKKLRFYNLTTCHITLNIILNIYLSWNHRMQSNTESKIDIDRELLLMKFKSKMGVIVTIKLLLLENLIGNFGN